MLQYLRLIGSAWISGTINQNYPRPPWPSPYLVGNTSVQHAIRNITSTTMKSLAFPQSFDLKYQGSNVHLRSKASAVRYCEDRCKAGEASLKENQYASLLLENIDRRKILKNTKWIDQGTLCLHRVIKLLEIIVIDVLYLGIINSISSVLVNH